MCQYFFGGNFVLTPKTASEVLDDIRRIKRLDSDSALGILFGVKQPTVASWRARNTLPYADIISFCIKERISTDYLFISHRATTINATKKDRFSHEYTKSYEVDDLFATRLRKSLEGKTIDWLAEKSKIDIQRINTLISDQDIPTVDELEAIADAFGNINPAWLAEKSPSAKENWEYEYCKRDNFTCLPGEIFKLYLVAADKFIEQMGGLIVLSPEAKANVIITASRIHAQDFPEIREANPDLIGVLLELAQKSQISLKV